MVSRPKHWLIGIGSDKSFLSSLNRTDIILWCAFLSVIFVVIVWERFRGITATDERSESETEIVCPIGDVAPGSKFKKVVPIKNTSTNPVTIKSISRTCSCLMANLEHDTIQPGSNVNLFVEFLSPDRQGGFQHKLVLDFVAEKEPVVIHFFGTVSAWIRSNVSGLEFDDTLRGEVNRRCLQLRVDESWPKEQRSIKCRMPHTDVESVDVGIDGKTVTYTIAFRPPADSDIRECEGDIVVDWIGHRDRGFKVPCKGKIVTEWDAEPSQVFLGEVSSHQFSVFEVQIRNRRYTDYRRLERYKITSSRSELLNVSSVWNIDHWQVTGSLRENSLLQPGIKSADLCIGNSDGKVLFRVPVYWKLER